MGATGIEKEEQEQELNERISPSFDFLLLISHKT
jgi:hypothetical protein